MKKISKRKISKRRVSKRIRAAARVTLLALILLCFAGCGKEKQDSLPNLSLEENRTEKESTLVPEEAPDEKEQKADAKDVEASEADQTDSAVFVYVCGAVVDPGVYELHDGARIYEALALAGGAREDAAAELINQAQKLTDGERIYIPTKEEAEKGLADTAGNPVESSTSGEETKGTGKDGKVNINTASLEELKTLNGIGDTRAQSILEYRETNGAFQTIEDLKNVNGIKDGVFEKIKDRITVKTGS